MGKDNEPRGPRQVEKSNQPRKEANMVAQEAQAVQEDQEDWAYPLGQDVNMRKTCSRIKIFPRKANSLDKELLFSKWLMRICEWFRSSEAPEVSWISILSFHAIGSAQGYMTLVDIQVVREPRMPYNNCQDWIADARTKPETTTVKEQVRNELRRMYRTGNIKDFAKKLFGIMFRNPDVTCKEALSAFIPRPQEPINSQVLSFVRENIEDAIALAEIFDSVRQMHNIRPGYKRPVTGRRFEAPCSEVNAMQEHLRPERKARREDSGR